jgi:hypothetical protein
VISVRGEYDHVPYLGQLVGERRNSRGEIAIIVADQNFHITSMSERVSWVFEAALTILKVPRLP